MTVDSRAFFLDSVGVDMLSKRCVKTSRLPPRHIGACLHVPPEQAARDLCIVLQVHLPRGGRSCSIPLCVRVGVCFSHIVYTCVCSFPHRPPSSLLPSTILSIARVYTGLRV